MKKVVIFSLLFLIACVGYFILSNHTYELTEKDIQAQIDKKIPLKLDGKRVDILIEDIRIDIQDNNLKTKVYYEAETLGESFNGIYTFNSVLLFEEGSVYLTDIKDTEITMNPIESKKIQGIKNLIDKYKQKDERVKKMFEKGTETVKEKIKETVNQKVKQHFKEKPIYVLKDKSFKHSLVSLALKDLVLEEDKIVLKFGL